MQIEELDHTWVSFIRLIFLYQIPISGVHGVVNEAGEIAVPDTLKLIKQQINLFNEF